MCVALMYQAGITRLFYAGAASDSAAFFDRLSEHDPKWALRMTNRELREQVGLPIGQRSMPAEQLMAEDIVAVFDAFVDRHT
jgi:hypothetical protein